MSCAHCGAAARGTELYCSGCGRAFIPDVGVPRAQGGAAGATLTAPAPARQATVAPLAPMTPGSRSWAAAAHATALVGALSGGIAAFVGPMIIWLVRRDDPFAGEHARQALNFHLSVLLYAVVGTLAGLIVTLLTIGLAALVLVPLALVAVVGYLVVSIVGALAAADGRPFTYPLTLPLFR
jgi:uncharacterized Tic20 family protein